jgi:hypothetical protein
MTPNMVRSYQPHVPLLAILDIIINEQSSSLCVSEARQYNSYIRRTAVASKHNFYMYVTYNFCPYSFTVTITVLCNKTDLNRQRLLIADAKCYLSFPYMMLHGIYLIL